MSEESGAIRWETVIIVFCIIGVFAAALIYAARWGNKRTKMMQEFAQTRGWGFTRADKEGLKAKADAFFPIRRFDLNCIVSIETGTRLMRFFDFYHNWRDRQRGGGFGTGYIIESQRFRNAGSGVELMTRTVLDSAVSGFDSSQVDMGDTEFGRNFIVFAKDREAARRAVTGALQTELLAFQRKQASVPLRISINAAGAMIWTGMYDDPQQWTELIELCRKIEASMP